MLQADGEPLGREAVRVVHQRLDFHQQRAAAFLRDQHARAGHVVAVAGEEDGGGVGHAFEAVFQHGEHAQLVGRAEAVFDGANHAVVGMLVAFEIQHGIHHVFQHARAGNRAVFGDVADKNHGDAHLLGHAGELGGALAHLRHGAGRGGNLVGIHGLNRVDDHHGRLVLFQSSLHRFQTDFRQQMHAVRIQPQTLRAQGDLLRRFFARHIQHFAFFRHQGNGLQQQRGFADARVAAQQNHRTAHQPAAEHAVKFAHAGGLARHFGGGNFGQLLHLRGVRRPRLETGILRLGRGNAFLQGVPLAAVRAFALPLGHDAAAFGAGVEGFGGFGHLGFLLWGGMQAAFGVFRLPEK